MIVHVSASVTLTRWQPWHWLSVIYTQCQYAPMTLTICTCDIDWVWFTLSIDMHPWHWLSAPVTLTGCDLHSVSICTHDIDYLHPWHWLGVILLPKEGWLCPCRHQWHWLDCTNDIDWVWFTLSVDMRPWHWLSASVTLTGCDLHSVSKCTRDIDYLHQWHWLGVI